MFHFGKNILQKIRIMFQNGCIFASETKTKPQTAINTNKVQKYEIYKTIANMDAEILKIRILLKAIRGGKVEVARRLGCTPHWVNRVLSGEIETDSRYKVLEVAIDVIAELANKSVEQRADTESKLKQRMEAVLN